MELSQIALPPQPFLAIISRATISLNDMLNGLFKTLFERPFTFAELRRAVDGLIASPPLPDDLRQELAKLKGKSGDSFLDYWRQKFELALVEISQAPTWRAQRAALIKRALREQTWLAAYRVSNECKHIGSWEHFFDSAFEEGNIAEDQLRFLLLQRYFEALLSSVVLQVLGGNRYRLDKTKSLEIELYRELDTETKRFVTGINEAIFKLADAGEQDAVSLMADIKETYLRPICRQLIDELSVAEEQIVNGSLNVDAIRKARDAMQSRKREIAKILQSESFLAREGESVNWLTKYLPDSSGEKS
jgi:hypothetical protein